MAQRIMRAATTQNVTVNGSAFEEIEKRKTGLLQRSHIFLNQTVQNDIGDPEAKVLALGPFFVEICWKMCFNL